MVKFVKCQSIDLDVPRVPSLTSVFVFAQFRSALPLNGNALIGGGNANSDALKFFELSKMLQIKGALASVEKVQTVLIKFPRLHTPGYQ